jgi:hypothetical protein
VPLIGQLSNPDIQKQLSRLRRDLEQAMVGNGSVVRERHACRCGCEREVAQPRKFVDQAHYDRTKTWRQLALKIVTLDDLGYKRIRDPAPRSRRSPGVVGESPARPICSEAEAVP